MKILTLGYIILKHKTQKLDSLINFECEVIIFKPHLEPELCEQYVTGHHQVLEDHGLGFLTSREDYWSDAKDSFAALALMNGMPIGGVRLERRINGIELPLQRALKKHESEVEYFLDTLGVESVYEACGLWNSKSVAGFDLAVLLCRVFTALAPELKIDRILSLNGLYTYRIPRELGMRMVTEIGENGFFKYPIERFHSALWIHEDLQSLSYASIAARNRILSLRKNINQTAIEETKKGKISIRYNSLL